MIDLETKENLLKEIEKSGNVHLSCMKIGVDKATFYRWKKDDKQFNKRASEAVKRGRDNNCDIAEHALLLKIKEKDLGAIKYQLSHNSPRYKPKIRKVIIEHSQIGQKKEEFEEMKREHWNQITEAHKNLGDLLRRMHLTEEQAEEILKNVPDINITDTEDSASVDT